VYHTLRDSFTVKMCKGLDQLSVLEEEEATTILSDAEAGGRVRYRASLGGVSEVTRKYFSCKGGEGGKFVMHLTCEWF